MSCVAFAYDKCTSQGKPERIRFQRSVLNSAMCSHCRLKNSKIPHQASPARRHFPEARALVYFGVSWSGLKQVLQVTEVVLYHNFFCGGGDLLKSHEVMKSLDDFQIINVNTKKDSVQCLETFLLRNLSTPYPTV